MFAYISLFLRRRAHHRGGQHLAPILLELAELLIERAPDVVDVLESALGERVVDELSPHPPLKGGEREREREVRYV